MAVFEIQDLTFTYAGATHAALRNVGLTVERGELVLLCGASGCGKTTLLRLLKQQLSPHGEKSGSILFNGGEVAQLDAREAAGKIGYVMQNAEEQTVTDRVWHELAFGAESLGFSNTEMRRKIAEVCGFFGISEWYHREVAQLSGGQKQILSLASVLLTDPEVLILDEPTAMLDPIAATQFLTTVRRIHEEFGMTVIVAEHRLEELFPIADRVVFMEKGRILFDDSPRALGRRLAEGKIEKRFLMGLPSALRVYAELKETGDCPLTVREGKRFLKTHYQNKIQAIPTRDTGCKKEQAEIIRIEDGYFRYERDSEDVLCGVDLTVYEGETLCILGANGVGKSTLLRVLGGVRRLWRGKYRLMGKKIKQFSQTELYQDTVALLPQNPRDLFLSEKLIEDLREATRRMGISKEDSELRIKKWASFFEIESFLERHPYDLSGGEQQRAAIAKLLLTDQKILLLDEPTKGLDACAKEKLAWLLQELKTAGKTIVIVTHDVEFAASYADRCAMFFDGQITSVSSTVDFFSGNRFYTTAAARMSADFYTDAVTVEDVVALCRLNGRREES